MLGSVVSVALAGALAKSFSGEGLVPTSHLGNPALQAAVGGAGAITILLATLLGMPTSTTHALTGALAGVAVLVDPAQVEWTRLWSSFFLPLLISPFLAIGGAAALYVLFHRVRLTLEVHRRTCVCVGTPAGELAAAIPEGVLSRNDHREPVVVVADENDCEERYDGNLVGLKAQSAVDGAHVLSGAAVCFSRAVNDTPKIAALLFAGGVAASAGWKLGLVAVAMALGGLLHTRKVAETMSTRITELNPGQGLTANLTTAALVLGASRLGVPVSTTHVSCGSIFGIGMIGRSCRWKTVTRIATTWVTTLPAGAAFGALFYWILTRVGL